MKKETTPSPPEKLSDLLRLAVRDCQKVEKMKTHRLNMVEWHAPYDGVCHVCMAGAVVDRTLGADPKVHIDEPLDVADDDWADALLDIDSMRRGYLPYPAGPRVQAKFRLDIHADFDEQRQRANWSTYLEAADFLEEHGL